MIAPNRFKEAAETPKSIECKWIVTYDNWVRQGIEEKISTWYRPHKGETIDTALEAVKDRLPRTARNILIEKDRRD